MAKLYIFGIGGTGSRVVKSLMMLFASGVKLGNNFNTVIPIIIDPDIGNGDLNRTKDILRLYQEIRNQINHPQDFFSQEVKTVNELSNNSSVVNIDDFQFALNNINQTSFGEYIGFNSLSSDYTNSQDDKNLTRLLFSDQNLNSKLDVGFKGNPNMGAIVLNQFTDSEDFLRFGQTFSDGDAIFIISSIFGGTGAAGFPLLLKNLRGNTDIPNSAKIRSAPIGGISYLPYFALNKKDEVNSDSFEDKAKIAIDYYNRTIINQNKINTIYFLGNKGDAKYLEYAVGGIEQKNNANFLELAGALAINDFCKHIQPGNNSTQVKEFGIENDSGVITFNDLNLNDQQEITKPLTKYKLFSNYLNFGLEKALNISRWTKSDIRLVKRTEESSLNEAYFNSPEYKIQIKAFNDHFDAWLKEMKDNKPAFSPFKVVNWSNALNLLNGVKNHTKKLSFKPIDIENCKLISEIEISDKKHNNLIWLFERSTENVLKNYELLRKK